MHLVVHFSNLVPKHFLKSLKEEILKLRYFQEIIQQKKLDLFYDFQKNVKKAQKQWNRTVFKHFCSDLVCFPTIITCLKKTAKELDEQIRSSKFVAISFSLSKFKQKMDNFQKIRTV